MAGLVNIIRRRGGIHTLHSSEMVILLSFWYVSLCHWPQKTLLKMHRIDVSGSFLFDSAPFFPLPLHLLTHIPNTMPTSPTLEKWNIVFPDSSDITDFLCQAANLTNYIENRAVTSKIWKDDYFVSRTFNGVVHQLLSLERRSFGGMEKSAFSPEFVMREAIRQVCLLLFGLLRDKFSVRPSGIQQHKNKVEELLLRHKIEWSGFLDLQLWVLLTASLAAEHQETLWYITEMKAIMVQMGLSGWDEIVGAAKNVLWMGESFKIRIDELKEVFEGSA